MKKYLVILLIIFFHAAPLSAKDRLPFAAGIVINKSQKLFQTGEVFKAIKLLETFTAKKQGLDPEIIEKKGYDHYYVHFVLGNYYLDSARDPGKLASKSKGEQTAQRTKPKDLTELISRAESAYRKSVKKNPSFPGAWLNLAACLYEKQSYGKAAEAFRKGYNTSENPKPVHLYYSAVCLFQADDAKEALVVFERLIKAHPGQISLEWKETLVNILFALEFYKKSLPLLEELAAESEMKKRKKWQEILLYQYISLQMDKKALSYAKYLTRIDPLEPKWWKALCNVHLDGNRYKQGLSALIICGYIKPLSREELKLAADLYMSLEIPLKAADFYEQVLKGLEKEDVKPLKNPGRQWLLLGYSAMNSSQYERAKYAFEQALKYDKQKKKAKSAIAQIEIMETLEAPLKNLEK